MSGQVIDQLAERHRSEALFHDQKYETGSSTPRHYRSHPTAPVFERLFSLVADNLSRARVLEYGCGTGWITSLLARRGASVLAFDISPEAVAQTQQVLASQGLLQQCDVEVMPGEHLRCDDNSVDTAIGFAILHHLQLDLALRELHRVLKPGGRAVFAEPLDSNPLIRMYRRLTPRYRTPDERPLDLDTFAAHVRRFSGYSHQEQLLLASAALVCCYIPGLSSLAAPLQRLLMKADDAILRAWPSAGRWAWYTIIVLEK